MSLKDFRCTSSLSKESQSPSVATTRNLSWHVPCGGHLRRPAAATGGWSPRHFAFKIYWSPFNPICIQCYFQCISMLFPPFECLFVLLNVFQGLSQALLHCLGIPSTGTAMTPRALAAPSPRLRDLERNRAWNTSQTGFRQVLSTFCDVLKASNFKPFKNLKNLLKLLKLFCKSYLICIDSHEESSSWHRQAGLFAGRPIPNLRAAQLGKVFEASARKGPA